MAVSRLLLRGGPAHERRKDAVLAADGLLALEHVRADRRALSRRSLGAELSVCRAIPGHGVRPTDLPRELARYRGVPVGSAREALAYGLSRTSPAFDPRGREPDPRLAHLRGVRAAADRTGETALRRREPVGGPEQHRLRVGFDHHRFMLVIV